MQKFNAKKKAESEAGSRIEGVGERDTPQIPVSIPKEDVIRKVSLLVYIDLETATGSEAYEIIQIAYCLLLPV